MNYTHQEIFNIGIAIANKEISKSDGIELLIKKTNINKGSAQMILGQIFPKLFFGEVFTRTLSAQLFDDLLFLLLRNYGTEKLEIAVSALKQHIDYIQTKGDSKVKLRKIVQKYSDLLMQSIVEDINEIVIDEREQNELVELLHLTGGI
ncbi:hypothetical protein [Pedobacter sp. Leaf132]|uniref:hypothetical protein n=1 Tax=Pedobacter sp. Leaf132 TaxID=2876557 RepID=UPI001E287CDC|nr:hypothetical protein [Pedobacter sp. Leaf132]